MPSAAYKEYIGLLKKMEDLRTSGEMTDETEKELEHRMEMLWFNMSSREAEALSHRMAEMIEPPDNGLLDDWC